MLQLVGKGEERVARLMLGGLGRGTGRGRNVTMGNGGKGGRKWVEIGMVTEGGDGKEGGGSKA